MLGAQVFFWCEFIFVIIIIDNRDEYRMEEPAYTHKAIAVKKKKKITAKSSFFHLSTSWWLFLSFTTKADGVLSPRLGV